MYNPGSLSEAIKLMLLVNMLFGLWIIKDPKKFNQRLIEAIYITLFLTMYVSLFSYTYINLDDFQLFRVFLLNEMVVKTSYIFQGITVGILLVIGRFSSRNVRKLIEQVDEYDRVTEKKGIPKSYNELYQYQWYRLIVNYTMIIINFFLLFGWLEPPMEFTSKKIIFISTHCFLMMFNKTCIFSLLTWLKCVKHKFKELNDLLRSLDTTKTNVWSKKNNLTIFYDFENKRFNSYEDTHAQRRKGNANTIRIIKQAHLELVTIAQGISDTYGTCMLFLMFNSFIYLTSFFYMLYRILWINLQAIAVIEEIVLSAYLALVFAVGICVVSSNCNGVIAESALAGEIICKLYEPSCSKEFYTEIRNFSLQLLQNPLKFTACGFFVVDSSFIIKIIQSIFTYLVILIQMADITMDKDNQNLTRNASST